MPIIYYVLKVNLWLLFLLMGMLFLENKVKSVSKRKECFDQC